MEILKDNITYLVPAAGSADNVANYGKKIQWEINFYDFRKEEAAASGMTLLLNVNKWRL